MKRLKAGWRSSPVAPAASGGARVPPSAMPGMKVVLADLGGERLEAAIAELTAADIDAIGVA